MATTIADRKRNTAHDSRVTFTTRRKPNSPQTMTTLCKRCFCVVGIVSITCGVVLLCTQFASSFQTAAYHCTSGVSSSSPSSIGMPSPSLFVSNHPTCSTTITTRLFSFIGNNDDFYHPFTTSATPKRVFSKRLEEQQKRHQRNRYMNKHHQSLFNSVIDIDEDSATVVDESSLRSLIFSNLPKDQEPDLLCDFLMEIGACSASIIDADRGTDKEQPLFTEPISDPWQDSLNWAAPIWNRCNVTAHFPASIDIEQTVSLVRETLQDTIPMLQQEYELEQVPNMDWVVHVQQSWNPIVVADGTFVLRFPWHNDTAVETALQQHALALSSSNEGTTARTEDKRSDVVVELQLQGGIAFGTGEHPTTQLCLEWIKEIVTSASDTGDESAIEVLDYGSGSGVLGMAACKLSKKVIATGIDIDLDACLIANANAETNDVTMRSYLPPLLETTDAESKSLLLKAHSHAQKQLADRRSGSDNEDNLYSGIVLDQETVSSKLYDVCVANILAGPLIALAPVLALQLKTGAPIGMSGILAPQGENVVKVYYENYFDNVRVTKERKGWVLVTGTRSDQPVV